MPAEIEDPLELFRAQDTPIKVEEPKKDEVKKDEEDDKKPVKVLRQERDNLRKELADKEAKLKELEEFAPLKPIAEHIKKKAGKIDPDVVNDFIERNRTRKKELVSKEETLKKKDQDLREFSIQATDEWRENYEKPLNEARHNFAATVVKVDKEGKPIAPDLHANLMQKLITVNEKGEPKTPIEIKGILKAFAEEFEKKTGVEWDVPTVSSVVSDVNSIHKSIIAANKAKTDWEEEITKKKQERIFDEQKKTEAFRKKELENRAYAFDSFLENLDKTELEGIVDPNIIITSLKTEHSAFNDVLLKKEGAKPKDYKEYLAIFAKAAAYETLLAKAKELSAENKKLLEDVKSGLPNRGSKTPPKPNLDTGNPLDIFE